jgi:hypothetical protein
MRCPSLRKGAAAAHASDVCSIHVLRPRRQPQRLRKKRIVAAAIFKANNVYFLSLLLSLNKSKVYSNFKRHGNTRPVVITSGQSSRVRTGDLDHFGCLLEPEDGATLPELGMQVGPKSVFWRNVKEMERGCPVLFTQVRPCTQMQREPKCIRVFSSTPGNSRAGTELCHAPGSGMHTHGASECNF